LGTVKTLHIVGFKNSGKTTLIKRWIQLLKRYELKVSVIKHHGHGAKLAMPDKHKDSMQYIESGADASLVAGAGNTQYILNKQLHFTQLKYLASLEEPDVLLIEGYKEEHGEKVVLLRENDDWEKLRELSGIMLVIGKTDTDHGFKQIASRNDTDQLDEWILNWLKE